MSTRFKVPPNLSGTYRTIQLLTRHKSGKVGRVLNAAAEFHGASLFKSLLTGPDLQRNLIYVLLRFRQRPFAVSAEIEGTFLQVRVLPCDQLSLRFCAGMTPHQILWYTSTHATSVGQKTRPPALTTHYSARHVTMLNSILKQQKPLLRTSTWTIAYIQWNPRDGPHKVEEIRTLSPSSWFQAC